LSSNKEDNRMKTSLENASVDFLNPKQSLSLSTTLNKSGQPLSGGQQKRINLARAFYHDSDILILDEPTASLDSETKDRVLQAIQREKKKRPVILITHDRETFEICDRFLEKTPEKERLSI
ncbi:MAG TPA: ATP-binding cassette domain-containing protein, partial [Thermotogota bacterium]|nr:ATP-binding cassette domain-containing protein [Thermotogota bacterium]